MFLSIITINRNDRTGLKQTMESVLRQTSADIEHIVVDGASTDGSVELIKALEPGYSGRLTWVSEPDSGIYNAMNKGLAMAHGDYVQILNSGDMLASDRVVECVEDAALSAGFPHIIYGNMIKVFPDGSVLCDRGFAGQKITMLGMYGGTLNHDSTFVRRELFEKYGRYDESLKICSDWEWFFKAVVSGGEVPVYVDVDMTLFKMDGISEDKSMAGVISEERNAVMRRMLPPAVLEDYENYSGYVHMMRRIGRHKWAYAVVRFLERILFKMEKHAQDKSRKQVWG